MGQLADNLASFRSEYGRLCILIAQALSDGHTRDAVVEAAQGLSLTSSTLLTQIRQQRDRANSAYFASKRLGAPVDAIVEIARECRRVVGGEFMMELPLLKGATA